MDGCTYNLELVFENCICYGNTIRFKTKCQEYIITLSIADIYIYTYQTLWIEA